MFILSHKPAVAADSRQASGSWQVVPSPRPPPLTAHLLTQNIRSRYSSVDTADH